MNALAEYPLTHALGWTLLHFCWQGAAVAGLLWCVLGALGRRSSQARYAAACFALALMAVLPLATFARLAVQDYRLAALHRAPLVAADLFVQAGLDGPAAPWPVRLSVALDHSMPWLLATWLLGVAFFVVRLNFGLLAARRMRSAGTSAPSPGLLHLFAELRARLGIHRAVQLLHSACVQVPTVIGWLRPVVLLPASCLSGLSPAQIEALLCHELAHIRRHDYLVSVMQSVVETLLFYHPAVWWVSRQVRRERECCCDDLAVANGGDVLAYARALSWLEEQRSYTPQLALGANGGVLKMRIQRLLGRPQGSTAAQLASIAVLVVLAFCALGIAGRMVHAEARGSQAATAPAQVQAPAQLSTPSVSAAGASSDRTASHEPVAGGQLGAEAAAAPSPQEESSQPQALASSDATRDFLLAQFEGLRSRLESQNAVYDALRTRQSDEQQLNENDLRRLEDIRQTLEESRNQWNDLLAKLNAVTAYEAQLRAAQAATANANTPEFRRNMEQRLAQSSAIAQKSAPQVPTVVVDAPASPSGTQRVPAGVMQGHVLTQPTPVYPEIAKAAHVQGVVVLHAIISKEGQVEKLSVVSGSPMLVQSAKDAVQQWIYRPYFVHGEPVEVETTINVNFTFGGDGPPSPAGDSKFQDPIPPTDAAGNPVRKIGGSVSTPLIVHQVQPEFTTEARKAKFMGMVLVGCIVNEKGEPEDVHVVRGIGLGLNDKAIEAVKQYKFKPATDNGQPVPVRLNIEVNFQIF